MSDKFQKDKLKKENIALWHRYLTQEGLMEEQSHDFAVHDMADEDNFNIHPNKGDAIEFTTRVKNDSKDLSGAYEIDKRTDQKLRQGKLKIDARIDLHGFNRHEARDKCIRFINKSYNKGVRTLLVITGKGRPNIATHHVIEPEDGILKQSLPEWLHSAELRSKVLKYYPAHKKHGGTGAFYVYLRKNK